MFVIINADLFSPLVQWPGHKVYVEDKVDAVQGLNCILSISRNAPTAKYI